jgi:Uma2 family endonuclease
MPVSEATYRLVALEDLHGDWEFVCGELRRKPGMTMEHYASAFELAHLVRMQLDRNAYHVRCDQSRVITPAGNFFIPDMFVVPTSLAERFRGTGDLEGYREALPFIAEVWSGSTGDYDRTEKLQAYRDRGDLEIWLIHPYERTVTTWRRQPAGSYAESTHRAGTLPIESLPGVTIDLAALFP